MITTVRRPEVLRAIASRAAVELADASATEILTWAAEEFGDGLAVACSMQDTVLAHLASRVRPGIDVLFGDTGYHFAETLGTAEAVEALYDVTLRRLLPLRTVDEQDELEGPRLYARDPDLCCALRKVAPMNAALRHYEAWATGLRRADGPTRANTPVVGFDERRQRVTVAPLAAWSDEQVAAYVDHYAGTRDAVLVNTLLGPEYPSIGCEPCTQRVAPGADSRSGRWAGTTKTECGLHT